MKKKNIFNILAGLLLLSVVSCKSKLEDLYLDPDGFTDPTIEGFYTNLQQQLGIFRYSYGEMFHNFNTLNPILGSGGFQNDGAPSSFSWVHDPYSDAFGKLRSYAAMQQLYNTLPEQDKKDYEIFMWTGGAVKEYIYHQLTDICGDVPYFKAMQGAELNFTPPFDKQSDIYPAMLASLKEISTNLKGYTLNSSFIQQQFPRNDIYFGGDITKWRVFINSLRMRLALRLTNVSPALAKSTIQEVLADDVYAKDRATSITLVDKQQDRAMELLIFRSLSERMTARLFVPANMLNLMRKPGFADDPRIPVLFQPDKDGNYTAMPTEAPDVTAISGQITTSNLAATFPSFYNRTTFERNFGMPYQIITSSEIHLLKAEAKLRWADLTITAADEYRAAIKESIDIYYEINALNQDQNYTGFIPASKATKPSDAVINTFLDQKVAEFNTAAGNEKIGLIYDQRYIHYNMLKPYELWADTRRLMKELGARVRKAPSNIRMMERTVYPTSEELNNPANFQAVKAANNYTTPVWWTGR
ncbi:SusD/RagB family nutrient-binding outer membrane lipoprotein [Chitinophaga sp. YIM B06452]|uniref:SusD/RagB family nutrient-binding outer membrane lipoprotein n=1 Tax=Chitinophaga sp. YIM B06452 TaxID=3082158 RepID=UPI0031FE4991